MFCEKCGQELPEGTKFCTACGEKVISPDMTVPMQKMEAEAALSGEVFDPRMSASSHVIEENVTVKHRSPLPIIIGVVCAVVVIAAVIAALLFLGDSEESAELNGDSSASAAISSASPSSSVAASSSGQDANGVTETEGGSADRNDTVEGEDATLMSGESTSHSVGIDELVKNIRETFGDEPIASSTYTLEDGSFIMLITNSDNLDTSNTYVLGE